MSMQRWVGGVGAAAKMPAEGQAEDVEALGRSATWMSCQEPHVGVGVEETKMGVLAKCVQS